MFALAYGRLSRAYAARRTASTTLLSLALAACAVQAQPAPTTIETLEDLRSALGEAGISVSQVSDEFEPELGVEGQSLLVGGAPLIAYEFDSVEERRLISDTIRAGGYQVNGEPVE